MPSLDGVFVPVTTPFRGDDVAPDRLADNLRRSSATPLAGWVVLGSTGEFPMLDAIERDRILAAAREAIPRDRCFIAGTGADSTLHTIRQTRRAAELGADVAIVITPHYFTRAFSAAAAQVRHFLAVADASPITAATTRTAVCRWSSSRCRSRTRRSGRASCGPTAPPTPPAAASTS